MNFLSLYNIVLENILLEGMVSVRDIGRFHAEIETIMDTYGKDKAELKKQLKHFKKKVIAKLVKEDYNSILTTYFPQLVPYKKTTDDAFYNMMFKHPDVWTDMTHETFREFIDKIEEAIKFFAYRNNGEHDNLRYLLMRYIRF